MHTVKELRQKCRDQHLVGYSKMNKNELIKYLGGKEKENNDIGIHIFKGVDMADSISAAITAHHMNAIQIFTHGPRTTARVDHDYKKIREVSKDINIYVHSSYPTNPWNQKLDIQHTIDQFVSSDELGSKGVVLHIPKLDPVSVAKPIKTLVDILTKRDLLKNQKVILEMKAVSQDDLMSYESPTKINRLIDALIAEGLTSDNIGICIDTAHIYAGKAVIYTYEDGVKYCSDLQYPEWIYLLHLNGNVYDAEKRAGDKHAIPFDREDKVWKGLNYNISGCKAFIEYAHKKRIDIILEVKDHHTPANIDAFINMIK